MNRKLKWLLNSRAYTKASSMVQGILKQPEALKRLVQNTNSLLAKQNLPALNEVTDSVRASLRLLRCYANGEYRDISIETLGLIVASLVYLVMPFDLLPDFIMGLGYTDDAALLVWTFKSVAKELRKFLEWEARDEAEEALLPNNASLEDLSKKSDIES